MVRTKGPDQHRPEFAANHLGPAGRGAAQLRRMRPVPSTTRSASELGQTSAKNAMDRGCASAFCAESQ